MKKITLFLLSIFCLFLILETTNIKAEGSENEYIIYPKVHSITYNDGSYLLQNFRVEYGESIDQYTKKRVEEVLSLKNLQIDPQGRSSLKVVSIQDEFDFSSYNIDKNWLSNHLDSYILISDNSNIVIVGKDTDSAFYGVTTLYHIFTQIENLSIRNFRIEDYADIPTRGYIEGYYGNPWSVEDRVELMKWGGYYKLNAYIYAPKDDPKHNRRWRELYTDDELKRIIVPQAKAGNESKNKFIYALHPYMNRPIRLGDSYQKDMNDLKAKFRQVIDNGVRQISILADDAAFMGKNNYITVLKDLGNWLKEEIKPIYPDMSLTIPFCVQEYMGWGETYFNDFPENVQIIMTGGKVWGTVNQNFGSSFKNKTKRNVLYWINWPCSDNSKNHLIMGGYADFLHPRVDKSNIDGIVLNPMQQSEPSKVAIFGNASYSWRIWQNRQEADEAWEYSFNYVDHNSVHETEASAALRNLSKNMINQAMDGRVIALQESLEIRDLLREVRSDLQNDRINFERVSKVRKVFEDLRNDTEIYRENAGNPRIADQIVYWLNCYADTTNSVLNYLDSLESLRDNDITKLVSSSNNGKDLLTRSRTYGFHYVNHTQYAEVGVQHIVPFLKQLSSYVHNKAKTVLDPNVVVQRFITSRNDNPVGNVDNVFDKNENTFVSFQDSSQLYFPEGTYVGVLYNKVIDVNNFEFLLGGGKNHFENAKLEYTLNGKDWLDVPLVNLQNNFVGIRDKQQRINILEENLPSDFKAMGIRLITTRRNVLDAYLNVHEIAVNKGAKQNDTIIEGSYSTNRDLMSDRTNYNNLKDNNPQTEVWISNKQGAYKDRIQADSAITLTFNEKTYVKQIHFSQGGTNKGDILDVGVIEYLKEDGSWQSIAQVGKVINKIFDVSNQMIETQAIRIRNTKDKVVWWRLGDFYATTGEKNNERFTKYTYSNVEPLLETIHSADEGTLRFADREVTLNQNQYVGFKLKHIEEVLDLSLPSNLTNIKVQIAKHPDLFVDYDSSSKPFDARYIKFISTADNTTLDLSNINLRYKIIGPKKVTSNFENNGERDVRRGNNLRNIFDGKLNTSAFLTGIQIAGNEVLFDLGNTINLKSLRYYINENSFAFPRSMDILVSNKEDGDFEKIIHIGPEEGIVDERNEKTAKSYQDDGYLQHDSTNPGNMYAEASGLDKKVRFIKFVIKTTYSHRWLEINELLINGGEYISVEPHKDIVSETIEKAGHHPSLALDGNYNTSYELSKAGNFDYRISEDDQRRVRIVQLGKPSNAQVKAVVLSEGNLSEIVLGNLNQTINEFALDSTKEIVEVKISSGEQATSILEITTSKTPLENTNKEPLRQYLLQERPYDSWTKNSQLAYDNAKSIADSILNNPYVDQNIVDSAFSLLKNSVDNANLKGDVSVLEKDLESSISQKQDEVTIYTSNSYRKYESALKRIQEALKDKDNLTQSIIDLLHQNLMDSKNALVYSSIEKEKAILALEYDIEPVSEHYTISSISKYNHAKDELRKIISSGNPKEIYDKRNEFLKTKEKLVNVQELKDLASREIDPTIYEEESYRTYRRIIDEEVSEVLKNGENEDVARLVEALKTTLVTISYEKEIERLSNLPKENYTKQSYQNFLIKLDEVKQLLSEEQTRIEGAKILKTLENDLVSIVSLKTQEEILNALNLEKYTNSSKEAVESYKADIANLKEVGSFEEIENFVSTLPTKLQQLELNSLDKKEEVENTKLIEENDKYRKDVYEDYKKAYDNYRNLDLSNISLENYERILNSLEEAKNKLVEKFELNNNSNFEIFLKDNKYYDGKKLVVDIVENESLKNDFSMFLQGHEITIFDIRLIHGGTEVQPDKNNPINIGINLNKLKIDDFEKVKLWHIKNGIKEEINFFIIDGVLYFDAIEFSNYVISHKKFVDAGSDVVGITDKPNFKNNVVVYENEKLPNTGASDNFSIRIIGVIVILISLLIFKKR